MTRPTDDNTPPDAPHAPGTDTDPHRGEVSEARPDLLRRLLDILGWESGTEEQALEALADAVRVARGGRLGKDVHLQRNEARAECERLRRELQAMVGASGLTMDQVLYRVRIELAHRDRLLCQRNEARAEVRRLHARHAEAQRHIEELTRELMARSKHPPDPADGPEGGAR